MTWRLNFTKPPRIPRLGKGLADPQKRTRAIVPEGSPLVNTQKHQSWLRPRRASRDGLLALNLHYCGRTAPLRVNLRRFWPPGAVVVARMVHRG